MSYRYIGNKTRIADVILGVVADYSAEGREPFVLTDVGGRREYRPQLPTGEG